MCQAVQHCIMDAFLFICYWFLLSSVYHYDQASLVQRDELQRCKLTNIELTNETVDLHKEIETLKEKVSKLVAENHILKGDLNRLPGM